MPPSKTSADGTPTRRRNGLQPACEPCRKAKTRCDNTSTTSVCSRCRKRQTPDICIFLDAPMTGQTPAKSKPRAPSSALVAPPAPCPHSPDAQHGYPYAPSERVYGSTGFFGSTSFSATIHQASNALKAPQDFDHDIVPAALMECVRGAAVLKHLPSFANCEQLLDLYATNSSEVGFPRSVIKTVFETFRATYKTIHLALPEELRSIATKITKNTREPLSSPDAAEEWKVSFSGPEMIRWESLGILFCAFLHGALSLGDGDGLFPGKDEPRIRKKKYVMLLKSQIETCIDLCRNSINTLVCTLLYKNLLLETVIHGDSVISVWRLHHDLAAIATAVGLHCYQGTSNITIHSEMAKKLSATVFWADKEISMFTGRPSALNRRYHSSPLPLDISDEALLAGGEVLQAEIDSLDVHGWNTKGLMHNATCSRMMMIEAVISDEILELFIGDPRDFSIDRVKALKKKTIKTYLSVPVLLQVTRQSLLEIESDYLMWKHLFNRLAYLRIHFLLERLLHERGGESKQKLLHFARELMDLTVFLWVQRDRTVGRHYDFDYVIMCYGMPSTGIICTSLLKQAQQPHLIPADEKLPTAEVVQSLSLMISFLEWVKPSAGNYELCKRMSQVIRSVLDQVFDPPAPSQDQEVWQGEDTWMGMTDEMSDLEWLNSIDWSRGPYGEFPQ